MNLEDAQFKAAEARYDDSGDAHKIDAKEGKPARKCRCDEPKTYRDEVTGERRCLCGSAI